MVSLFFKHITELGISMYQVYYFWWSNAINIFLFHFFSLTRSLALRLFSRYFFPISIMTVRDRLLFFSKGTRHRRKMESFKERIWVNACHFIQVAHKTTEILPTEYGSAQLLIRWIYGTIYIYPLCSGCTDSSTNYKSFFYICCGKVCHSNFRKVFDGHSIFWPIWSLWSIRIEFFSSNVKHTSRNI